MKHASVNVSEQELYELNIINIMSSQYLLLCHVLGLHSSVAYYAEYFAQAGINGRQLLMLTNDDLGQIGVDKLGHQEILLQSIALLQTLVCIVIIIHGSRCTRYKVKWVLQKVYC